MRPILRTAAAAAALLAVVAGVAPAAPADAAAPEGLRYVLVRVDTGAGGGIATDAQVAAAARGTLRFWAGVAGAPHVTMTIRRGLLHVERGATCWTSPGRDALAAAGVHLDPTEGVVAFLPGGDPCGIGYAGLAPMPGRDVEVYGTLCATPDCGPPGWTTLAHEVGHNMGLCQVPVRGGAAGEVTVHDRQAPSQWTPAADAGPTSYGNPYSIMGEGEGPPSAPCQEAAGWLTSTPLPRGHTVHVRALELAGDDRAWRFWDGGHLYTVEYRARPVETPVGGTDFGVVVYRDGFVLELAESVYAAELRKLVRLSAHQGIIVTAMGSTYAVVRRVTIRT
jgi:hypothetical protein